MVICQDGFILIYLMENVNGYNLLPQAPFVGDFTTNKEAASWALLWLPEAEEDYLTKVMSTLFNYSRRYSCQWLTSGLLDAMREFCEFRNLLPKNVKLTADDIWDRCAYVLSVKMHDAQFAVKLKNDFPLVKVRSLLAAL